MSEYFDCRSIEGVFKQIEEFARQQMEYKEKTLAEIITKYDFVVGSKECKCKLMEILPEGAKVICSPYIEDPTMIYAIKKFDTMDLLFEPQEKNGTPLSKVLEDIKSELHENAEMHEDGTKMQ